MPNTGDIIRASDLQDLLDKLNGNSSNIVGEFKYFGFLGVPEHCLVCDGSEISRSAYSELFERYGTQYGEGDGSTTFNLPDFRGAFFRCIGGNSESLGIRQGDAIRNITGNVTWSAGNSVGGSSGALYATNGVSYNQWHGPSYVNSGRIYFDASRVVPTAEENRPINFAVNVCVVYE